MEDGRFPPRRSSDDGAPPSKRRKVRKGTRSCWECRRRKIRCLYPSENATICVNCESRGTSCVSQEFPDEQPTNPERSVLQRLGRVEDMLEKLVERIIPDSYTTSQRGLNNASPASSDSPDAVDSAENGCYYNARSDPPVFEVLGPLRDKSKSPIMISAPGNLSLSESNCQEAPALCPKYERVSRTIHGLFPSQQDIDLIVRSSSGSGIVATLFARRRDIVEGRVQDPSSIGIVPDIKSHPAVLARRLMQLINCVQHLQRPTLDRLAWKEAPRNVLAKHVSIILDLVAHNDELVGNSEGVETLALIGLYHSNAGNMRKSWLIIRRALSIAQLMGVDRFGERPIKSADPSSDSLPRPGAQAVWFRLNFVDRYLSLNLGLPACVDDNSFLADDAFDEAKDRLEKQHAIAMGAIIKRNSCKGESSLHITRTIDADLKKAARSVPPEFWQRPSAETLMNSEPKERMFYIAQLITHMNHYNLLILLHLPYMLRDPKERLWDYSKASCINSSRQLLRTFLLLRNVSQHTTTCRCSDYSTLTASMTLLLGYLDPKLQAQDPVTMSNRTADRALIQNARDRLLQMAAQTNDNVSRDTASIIVRLLPLLDPELMARSSPDESTDSSELQAIHLEIPHVGTIHINPNNASSNSSACHQQDTLPHATDTPDSRSSGGGSSISPATSSTPSTAVTNPTPSTTMNEDYSTLPQYSPLASSNWASTPNDFPSSNPSETPFLSFLLDQNFPLDYHNQHPNPTRDDYNSELLPTMQFEFSQAQLAHPELAVEGDEWSFQGFDTTYFESLFSYNATGV